MSKDSYLAQAIAWAERKSVAAVKANFEGYEKPFVFTQRETQEEICPDVAFVSYGGAKNYMDIAMKDEEPAQLVTRWKLLSTMAAMKEGKLYLMTPKGHRAFVNKLVDHYNISAVINNI